MGQSNRIYKVNDRYFEKLENERQAYILGFLYADGNIYNDHLSFGQVLLNKDIVEKINSELDSTYDIKEYQPKKGNLFFSVSINSSKLCLDLQKLGCLENKSLILQFPTFIPDYLMPHFIRGYFDGDGCIWDGKPKIMTVKNEKKPGQFRQKLVHNVKFTFTGNYNFINALQDYLVKTLGFKKTKLNFSKAKNKNNTTSDSVCTMEYSGRGQVKKLYDYMYSNATLFGDTKKLKFEDIICASLEKSNVETVLIEETAEMPIVNQASNLEEGSSTIPEMGVESSDSKCTALNR